MPSNIIQAMGLGRLTIQWAGVHRFRGVLRAGLVANLGGRMFPEMFAWHGGFEEMIQ